MSIIERIYQIFDYKGDSVYKISKKIDVSNGYFSKTRAKQGNVGSDIIEKIVNYYTDINVEWLITGSGEMKKTKSEEKAIKKNDGIIDGVIDGEPNVKKMPSNENIDTYAFQQEVITQLKERVAGLEQDKKALIQDKERAYQDRDNWEHRYNLAQAEIRELKNVQDMGDTKTLVG